MMRRFRVFGPALLMVATATGAAGQTAAGLAGTPSIEYYRFTDPDAIGVESLSLFVVPVAARLAIGGTTTFEVQGRWASGTMTLADGSSVTVSGPTDTEVRLTTRFARDAVSVTVLALAPTGQDQLTSEEADVAGAFAADALPFRVTNWGSGGGLGAAVAFARQTGPIGVGLSAGYVVAREFDPLVDQDFTYRPGDQLHVTGALTGTIGMSAKASLSVTVERHSVDEANGLNLFQAGNRVQARGSLAFASGARSSGVVYLGYLRREQGEFQQTFDVVPGRNLVFAGGALRTPVGGAVLVPGADFRLLALGDGGYGGFTGSLGIGLEAVLGSATLLPAVRGRFGNIENRDGGSSTFTGFELGLGLRFGGS